MLQWVQKEKERVGQEEVHVHCNEHLGTLNLDSYTNIGLSTSIHPNARGAVRWALASSSPPSSNRSERFGSLLENQSGFQQFEIYQSFGSQS